MTIYTSKGGEKKEHSDIPPPEVVTDAPIEKKQNEANLAAGANPPTLITVSSRPRRSGCANLCVMLTALVVLTTGIIGGIYLYKHLAQRTFRGWCGVKYYEYREAERLASHSQAHHRGVLYQGSRRYYGQFEEKVEIDKVNGQYEKIDVPDLDECRRATILHDFERNLTAIVDKVNYHCFILPLNRSRVTPPRDFWDLLNKLSNGYYLPDAELVKERYQVVYPRVFNLGPYGYHIWRECHRFDTYHLERIYEAEEEPRYKRSAPGESSEEISSSSSSSSSAEEDRFKHLSPEAYEKAREEKKELEAGAKLGKSDEGIPKKENRITGEKPGISYNTGSTGSTIDLMVTIYGLKEPKEKEGKE